jgi:hypothetical protein
LFVAAYVALLTAQLRRAAALTEASFDDGVWGQRLETLSFVVFPQTLVVLAPAAAAGAAATLISGSLVDRTETWQAQLVRVVAGVCYMVILVAVMRIIALFVGGPDVVGDFGALLQQLGGILMAVAMIRVCLEAERSAA